MKSRSTFLPLSMFLLYYSGGECVELWHLFCVKGLKSSFSTYQTHQSDSYLQGILTATVLHVIVCLSPLYTFPSRHFTWGTEVRLIKSVMAVFHFGVPVSLLTGTTSCRLNLWKCFWCEPLFKHNNMCTDRCSVQKQYVILELDSSFLPTLSNINYNTFFFLLLLLSDILLLFCLFPMGSKYVHIRLRPIWTEHLSLAIRQHIYKLYHIQNKTKNTKKILLMSP